MTTRPGRSDRLAARAADLVAHRQPFVRATVVRAQSPTPTRAGDQALVLSDGSIEGFVGGQCAEESVRVAALASLQDGEPLLLRVLPGDSAVFPDTPGARLTHNPCLSGGALEIYLEPAIPSPVLEVVGDTPTAEAVASLADVLGFTVARSLPGLPQDGTVAAVIASHGHDEPESIRVALDAGVGFIGLVASRPRGEAVLAGVALTPEERARVHTPVGLEIGATTAEEIGLSILAAVVKAIRLEGVSAPEGSGVAPSRTSVDPVCGMTVAIGPDTPHLSIDDADFWFCNAGCRDRFAAQILA